jgi:ABC-type lipoprotein export system ATPase subunit
MDEVLVSLEGVSRHYSRGLLELAALTEVSCQVSAGARVAVIGPSGSGKSTLLHVMASLDEPTRGVVRWPALGPQADLRPDQIGMVFQTPSLLPTLTALENVELMWLLSRRSEAGARAAASRALEKLGLSALADKLPDELSGGQMQRVAVARALVCKPRLILADEPTGQLDGATALKLMDALLEVAAESGAALIVATHDPAMADRLGTHWFMTHGQLEQGST